MAIYQSLAIENVDVPSTVTWPFGNTCIDQPYLTILAQWSFEEQVFWWGCFDTPALDIQAIQSLSCSWQYWRQCVEDMLVLFVINLFCFDGVRWSGHHVSPANIIIYATSREEQEPIQQWGKNGTKKTNYHETCRPLHSHNYILAPMAQHMIQPDVAGASLWF